MSKQAVVLSMLLGGVIFTGCASEPAAFNAEKALNQANVAAPAPNPVMESADTVTANKTGETAQATQIPSRPQLIKKATMDVVVDSVDKGVGSVRKIIEKEQGDLIGLEETQPQNNSDRQTANIQLRVPQNRLDATLDELAKLGTVESRNITAEDVGEQLVDLQARLSNLRRTEANLQKLVDRAGSVRDILSVSQELNRVREQIERIDAQLKNLQNQVSYSTVTLNLKAAVGGNSPQRALAAEIQETWNNSTHSLGEATTGLLKLCIWLLVYSPYFLIFGGTSVAFLRWRKNKTAETPKSE